MYCQCKITVLKTRAWLTRGYVLFTYATWNNLQEKDWVIKQLINVNITISSIHKQFRTYLFYKHICVCWLNENTVCLQKMGNDEIKSQSFVTSNVNWCKRIITNSKHILLLIPLSLELWFSLLCISSVFVCLIPNILLLLFLFFLIFLQTVAFIIILPLSSPSFFRYEWLCSIFDKQYLS